MRSKNEKYIKKEKEIIFVEEIDKAEIKDNNLDKELLERTLQDLKEESEINPDLENFFDKVREKKEIINVKIANEKDEIDALEEDEVEEFDPKKKSTFGYKINVIILAIIFIAIILYFILY